MFSVQSGIYSCSCVCHADIQGEVDGRMRTHTYTHTLSEPQHYSRGADKSLARPGRTQANVSVRMVCISFGALPCRGGKNLMTAHISMMKSCTSLTCFQACFLSGQAKDLTAPW